MHTRYAGGRVLYLERSRDGIRWDEPRRLAKFGEGHYQVTCANGEQIGSAFDYHPARHPKGESGLNYRTNLHYMQSGDGGQTWTNVKGEQLTLPLADVSNPALAIDFESKGLLCYVKCMRYLPDGRPVILYLTSKGYESGPTNDPRKLMLTLWTGSEWITRDITACDNNYDYAFLDFLQDGRWQILGAIDPGPQRYNPGGEVAIWRSSDEGVTWRKTRAVTSGSKFNQNFPRLPVNARPDFYALWADGDARKPSESALYFCNQDGTKVFELPSTISGSAELIKPILLERPD
jgi:hypothetical protein